MDIEEIVPDEIGGICGIIAPIVAYLFIFISILVHPDFCWADNALSDLGAVDTSYNNIFNFGLILAGILGIVFTPSIFQLAESNIGYVGIAGFGGGMICLMLIGIFPSGTSPHYVVSILFFSVTNVGLIVFGIDQFLGFEYVWSAFLWSSIILSAVLFGILYSIPYELGAAIPEFVGTIPTILFSVVFGTRLITE